MTVWLFIYVCKSVCVNVGMRMCGVGLCEGVCSQVQMCLCTYECICASVWVCQCMWFFVKMWLSVCPCEYMCGCPSVSVTVSVCVQVFGLTLGAPHVCLLPALPLLSDAVMVGTSLNLS